MSLFGKWLTNTLCGTGRRRSRGAGGKGFKFDDSAMGRLARQQYNQSRRTQDPATGREPPCRG